MPYSFVTRESLRFSVDNKFAALEHFPDNCDMYRKKNLKCRESIRIFFFYFGVSINILKQFRIFSDKKNKTVVGEFGAFPGTYKLVKQRIWDDLLIFKNFDTNLQIGNI